MLCSVNSKIFECKINEILNIYHQNRKLKPLWLLSQIGHFRGDTPWQREIDFLYELFSYRKDYRRTHRAYPKLKYMISPKCFGGQNLWLLKYIEL